MNDGVPMRRWGLLVAPLTVPFLAWLAVYGALAGWNVPYTEGTAACWMAQCFVTTLTFVLGVVLRIRDKTRALIGAMFLHLTVSLALLTFALLTQIRMLLPLDR